VKTFVGSEYGRYIIMHLAKGDLILESIRDEIKRLGVEYGVIVSGVGTASKIIYHRIASAADIPENEFIIREAPMEIGMLQGLIIEGVPHLHLVFSDLDECVAGHLENGCVTQYLMEIVIIELIGADLARAADEFGVSYIIEK
jgi:predicted DNA-binding protein with PD1-like motif